MKFIDMFSGIGGFRTAMENNGHECIAYSEIDKHAIQSYQAMYNTENEIDLGDITNISQEYLSHFKKDNDMVVGGSPCQAFSVAGKQAGFEDTRGTLFFEYAKVVKETQPKYFLFENVKGMLSHDKGNTIRVVLETFNELGYYIDFNVFNSKYYGVPQNRERIYILGKRKDLVEQPKYHDKTKGKKKFDEIHNWAVDNINYVELLPTLQTEVTTRLVDVLEDEVDEKYYLSDEKVEKLTLDNDLGGDKRITMPVLTPDRLNKRQNGRRFKEDGEPMFTLTAEDRHGIAVREATKQGYAVAEQGDSVNVTFPTSKTRRGRVGKQVAQTLQAGEVNQGVVIDDTQGYDGVRYYKGIAPTLRSNRSGLKTIDKLRIRKLTPLECWRLQGFTDEQFYKAKNSGVSKSQLYKQAGNSVSVPVVDAIVKCL